MLGKTAKIVSILVAIAMVLAVFVAIVPKSSADNTTMPEVVEPEGIDIGPQIRDRSMDMASIVNAMTRGPMANDVFTEFHEVGDMVYYLVGEDPLVEEAWLEFEKRAEGNHCEVWVATDLSFPEGDPRNDGRTDITNDNVSYMVEQFDENIFPTESEFFGLPNSHTGDNSLVGQYEKPSFETEDGLKTMIMIFNIIDESYYDPTYPYYVVGYYSPDAELLYDRNIIHIDCWDWANRTTENVSRPFVYEGTVAHEYQHLLHDDADSDEDSWINEGCSMYSEFLCEYLVESEMWGGLYRFLYTPDNGLVEWGDQGDINILADYNSVLMFMIYMNDHFNGSEFISALFKNTDNGAASVTSTLSQLGYAETFDEVFHNWRLANLIHSDTPGNGLYNYESIDWSSGYSMELYDGSFPLYDPDYGFVYGSDWGTTWTYDGYDTGIPYVGSYGTDYIVVTDLWDEEAEALKLLFEGWEEIREGWDLGLKPTLPIYTEDFNYGGLLPSDWTIWGEGPDYQPWETYYWGGLDFSAVCWGDHAGPGSDITEWLAMDTVSLDLSDLAVPILDMFMIYQPWDGDEYIKVMVDAGEGWEEAAHWDETDGIISGYFSVNLSPWAGESEVRLGFKYHSTWDWVVLVDDLMVYDLAALPDPDDYAWKTGGADLKDWMLIGEVDLTDSRDSTLEFDTYYDIEFEWDFGFVQVSTDMGESWTSLANEYTVTTHNPSAHPAIIEQLPGLTGRLDGWTTMSFDLSDFDGQVIWLSFRYMTDWGTTNPGWWVDNIKINGELVDNGEDVISFTPVRAQVDWMVSVYVPAWGGLPAFVFDLNINEMEQTLRSLHALAELYPYFYLVVSPTTGMADYGFVVDNFY